MRILSGSTWTLLIAVLVILEAIGTISIGWGAIIGIALAPLVLVALLFCLVLIIVALGCR